MNIFKTVHRVLAVLAAFFAVVFTASAQDVKLSLGNLVFAPDKTTVVSLDLKNDVPVDAVVSADIFMPEVKGFKVVFEQYEKTENYVERTTRISEFADVRATTQLEKEDLARNQLRLMILDYDNVIKAGTGALVTFKVKYERLVGYPNAELPQDAEVLIKGANVAGYKFDKVSCKFNDATFEGRVFGKDFQITPSKEVTVSVNIANNLPVSMFQTDIQLPEGLSFVETEGGVFTPANRVALTHKIVSNVNGSSAHLIVQPKNLLTSEETIIPEDLSREDVLVDVVGQAGLLFTFKVKADEKLAAEDVITFTKTIGSSLGAKVYNFDDATIVVTNPDVEATATLDAAVKALDEKVAATLETFAEYSEDIQTSLAEQKAALETALAQVKSDVQDAKDKGTVAAGLAAFTEQVAAIETDADALLAAAKDAFEKAEAEAKAEEAKKAEAAQYAANTATVEVIRTSLKDAVAAANTANYDCAEDVEDIKEDIATLRSKIEAIHANSTSVAAAEEVDAMVAAINAKIEAVKEGANAAQNTADETALAEVKKAFADADATVDTYATPVVEGAAENKAAAEAAIEAAQAAIQTSFEAGTSVADKDANAALVAAANEAITKYAEEAKAAQDKFVADAAAANAAQNEADNAALAEVETALADAAAVVDTYVSFVVAAAAENKAAAEAAIKAAQTAIQTSFEAGTSVADKAANAALVAAANEAVTKYAEEAKAAQDALNNDDETFVIVEEFTSIADIADKAFAIIDKATGKALYGTDNQNLGYDIYDNAFVNTNSGYLFKLDTPAEDAEDASIATLQLLRLITPAGEAYNIWGNPGYLNTQPANGSCSFILGLNNQNGQDFKNGAVWDMQYVEGKGFTLLNKGTGLYLNNNGPANAEEPTYWTLCSIVMKNSITVAETRKGTITTNVAKAVEGVTVHITATPEEGYTLASLSVAAGDKEVEVSEDLTFVMPADNVTISAEFAPVPTLVYKDLSEEDYYSWTAADATGEKTELCPTSLTLNESTGLPFGDGNVFYLNYVDLSGADHMVITATEGTPRVLFNRVEDQGAVGVELPRDGEEYWTVADNEDGSKTYTIDIAKIVKKDGFAHMHCIKGANWVNTTVTSVKIGYYEVVSETFAITIAENIQNGVVTADAEVAEEGDVVTLSVTPAEDYKLESLVVTAGDNTIDVAEDMTFVMPADNVQVTATFVEDVPDAINAVNADSTGVRKVLENGKVVIYRNAKKYSVTGVNLK